jgi:hypothetical protein
MLDEEAAEEYRVEREKKVYRPLTDYETILIVEYRERGDSWPQIANAVDRPRSTVRSFYGRWDRDHVLRPSG